MEYSELVELYEKVLSASKRLDKTYYISEFLKLADDLDIIFLMIKGRIFPEWDETKIGFAAKMAIKAIASSSGISQDNITKLWKQKYYIKIIC
jgi:DNA ligase-1